MSNSIMGTEESQPTVSDSSVNYATFWIIPATVKAITPQQAVKNFVWTKLVLTVFETILLLPFILITPGLIQSYMGTILSWVVVIMVSLNVLMLLILIVNLVKVQNQEFTLSCCVVPIGYVYHSFALLVYAYILWGSKDAFAKVDIFGMLAALLITIVLVLHVMMIKNGCVATSAAFLL